MFVAIDEMRKEAEDKGKVECIRNLMKSLKLLLQDAMDVLGIPENQREKLMTML